MSSTIFLGVIVLGTLIIVLFFGYKVWRKSNRPAASRRRSYNRSSIDERMQNRYPQQGNPADAPTQLGHSRKGNSADARTISRSSQKSYLEDDQTKIRQNHKVKPTDEQQQLEHPHKVNSADAPTQVGRHRINNIEPEDDRTIL